MCHECWNELTQCKKAKKDMHTKYLTECPNELLMMNMQCNWCEQLLNAKTNLKKHSTVTYNNNNKNTRSLIKT